MRVIQDLQICPLRLPTGRHFLLPLLPPVGNGTQRHWRKKFRTQVWKYLGKAEETLVCRREKHRLGLERHEVLIPENYFAANFITAAAVVGPHGKILLLLAEKITTRSVQLLYFLLIKWN
jgi:hypothetical protein